MSYLNFFGLHTNPFDKKSDGAFACTSLSLTHAKARLNLVQQTGGIFHLYGEYGCGKSALLHDWIKSLPAKINHVYLDYVKVQAYGLLFLITKALKLNPLCSKVKLVYQLKEYLDSCTQKPVIIIDEAQDLPSDALNDIRMLTSQDFDSHTPFVLVLSSHPGFISKLNGCRALKQRVTLFHHLMPFTKEETRQYLQQRLKAAGCKQFPFAGCSQDIIFAYSSGIARKINTIATLCLIMAANLGLGLIDQKVCEAANLESSNY